MMPWSYYNSHVNVHTVMSSDLLYPHHLFNLLCDPFPDPLFLNRSGSDRQSMNTSAHHCVYTTI